LDQELKRSGDGKPLPGFEFKPPSFHSTVFYDMKDALVVSEIQILKRLGFNMQVSDDCISARVDLTRPSADASLWI
jgi:hypothetical protein